MKKPALLVAEKISTSLLGELSFSVAAGTSCVLVLPSREQGEELLFVLGGLRPPRGGRVVMFGQDLYALDSAYRIALFRDAAIVPESGGLISNLKAWENIMLPAAYHRQASVADIEPRVTALFRELYPRAGDLRSLMASLPDRLSPIERRLVGLVRAFVSQPRVLIYDFLLEGVDRDSAARLVAATADFQRASADRISVYLCGDTPAYERIQAEQTLRLEQ
jgi:predicted ABC-type transport system involved in lysophospholipase L1 biosynthesis ATPase subunit